LTFVLLSFALNEVMLPGFLLLLLLLLQLPHIPAQLSFGECSDSSAAA